MTAASKIIQKSAGESLSALLPSTRPLGNSRPAEGALASSPRSTSDGTLLSKMRAVLKRHQCGHEEEAATVCLRQAAQAASKPSAVAASSPCSSVINALRYCQLQTQQHNYPVAPAFLY